MADEATTVNYNDKFKSLSYKISKIYKRQKQILK